MKEIEGIDLDTYAGKAAKACKTKVRGIMGDDLLIFSLLDFVTFMTLNNKFASHGIFITDDNREDCYIKIIEIGDDSLLNELEEYINLKDSIKAIANKKEEYDKIIDELNTLEDHNDSPAVYDIVKEYLRR